LRGFVGGEGILAFLDAPWTPVFIALIWLLHPALGVLATAGAVILFVGALANDVVTRAYQQRAGPALRHSQAAAHRYVDSAETIKPLGMTGTVLARWQARRGDAHAEQQRLAETTATIANFSRAFRIALQMLILGVGAYYVLEGQLTSGGMIAASIILGRALFPIERSISAWRSFVSARAAYRNLERLFGGAEPAAKSVRLPRPQGRLAVQALRYHAPPSRDPIIHNVAFE